MASLLLPEALKETKAAIERQSGPKNVTDEDLALAKRLEHHFRASNETVTRVIADLLPYLDPKFKPASAQFSTMIGDTKKNANYEDFTILYSNDGYNHSIPKGETFIVTSSKNRQCVTKSGRVNNFSNTEKDCRPATQTEIENFFESLTQTHLVAFSSCACMEPIIAKAVAKLEQDLTPKTKKSRKANATKDGIVAQPPAQAVKQPDAATV
jgi:hypothetical protein